MEGPLWKSHRNQCVFEGDKKVKSELKNHWLFSPSWDQDFSNPPASDPSKVENFNDLPASTTLQLLQSELAMSFWQTSICKAQTKAR